MKISKSVCIALLPFVLPVVLNAGVNKNEPLKIEEKIYVYDVPIKDAFKVGTTGGVEEFTKNATPSDIFKKNGRDAGTIFQDNKNTIMLVIKEDQKHIQNFNNILQIAYEYAEKNIPLVDKNRIKDTLAMLKLKDEKIINKIDNKYKRMARQQRLETYRDIRDRTTNEIDFYDFTAPQLLDYFIQNYFDINRVRQDYAVDDKRLELVSLLKKKLISNPDVDVSLINYDITLTELKNLKKLIYSN